ncbi:MAG TPA: amidohydrolase family protein, partial [Rubrivivax sp.]|nr:amidohydrolase family protein [Rubrivivax sp.]
MAQAAGNDRSGKVVIHNVGLMLSGDIDKPLLDADCVVVLDGRIEAVGRQGELDTGGARTRIDARGTTLAPGLIDSHVHPVFGDWTPRQNQIGWIDSMMHGGVTTMISAGEVHLPGRPRDIVGLKALAITAQRAFDNFRPGGMRVLAGAPVIEKGMVESDFAELAAAGVGLLGEIGLGSVKAGDEAARMVGWARKHGIQSTIHTGGPSIPGSGLIDKDVVLEADADIIGHINGGHTALPEAHVCELCERSSRAIEIVHNGNERVAIAAAQAALQLKCPHRVILGTDSPAGSGVQPLGMLRLVALLASLGRIPAQTVWCFATGNTARLRKLNAGLIEPGRDADFVFLDRAQHSAGRTLLDSIEGGDLPGVG